MKTSKISKYLSVLLCALSFNMAWGQKTVRLYFNEYKNQAAGVLPTLSADGDIPEGTTISADGFVWASSYKETSFNYPNCEDRVFAKKSADKKSTQASLTFKNFKYEIKKIEWNRMNDIFSNSILDIFKIFSVYTTTTPYTGTQIYGSEGSWLIIGKSATFGVTTFPGTGDDLKMKGLSSLSIEEKSEQIVTNSTKEINDRCRFFIKAGTKEQEAARKPSIFNWNPDHCYAFQITYYEPVLSFNDKMPSEMAIGNEAQIDRKGSELYSIDHEGAFNFKKTYATSNANVIRIDEKGKMTAVNYGNADITMTITDGKVTKSVTKTIVVSNFTSSIRQYHHDDKNLDNLLVRDMNHNDDDYMLTKKTVNGFTLQSSNSKKFRAGLLDYNLSVDVPKYTSVTPKWDYNIKFSNSNVYAELMYVPENVSIDDINLNTNDDPSGKSTGYSFYRGTNNTSTSASYSGEVIYNNNNASKTTKNLHFAALAYSRRSSTRQVQTTFSYTTNHTYVYYSTVSFAKDIEECPFTMPNVKDVNSEAQDKHLPRVNDVDGYTFLGWSTQKGGTVEYENGAEFDPYDHANGGGKGPVTLYSVWEAKSYMVNLYHNDGSDEKDVIPVYYGQDMPNLTNIPTRTGYTFRGYYEGKDYSQTDDYTTKYYNEDGTSARIWDKTYGSDLYAHWTAKTYTINFDACGGRLSDKVGIRIEGQDRYIETSNDQSFVSFDVQYGSKIADRFWCSDKITIKPGYKFLGWYTEKVGGTKVYSVNDEECSFNAIEGDYWTADGTSGNWKYDAPNGTLNLYAQYECKFEIVDNGERINFKKGYDITSYDILAAIEEDLETYKVSPMIVDVTNYQSYILAGKGLGGFLGGKGYSIDENSGLEAFNTVIEEARLDNKLAPNGLVYLSGSSSMYTGATNVVMTNEKQCQNLEVTDRAPIKIPYAFKANKALYERNKNYNDKDAAKAQAANSVWGTLCLPYPIRNNANNVKFYELANFENNIMHYTPMNVDVIPANTPVLYKRLNGVGSDVKIEEADVDVPVNTSYSTNSGSSLTSWQFIGTLTTKIFCGKDYDDKKVPEGAEKMDGSKEIYYFKQDQFTHLSNTGKVTMLPYRAYFTTTAANAKFASFSIIAVDEEGATDITNLIDSDAEGDGKIYDLNGRRVMQPVSGRLYIVNGKKKVY